MSEWGFDKHIRMDFDEHLKICNRCSLGDFDVKTWMYNEKDLCPVGRIAQIGQRAVIAFENRKMGNKRKREEIMNQRFKEDVYEAEKALGWDRAEWDTVDTQEDTQEDKCKSGFMIKPEGLRVTTTDVDRLAEEESWLF